ncbi:calpain-2 catalytic subunit-like [Sphaeramia orbicularis]|uniref:Calpain-2 catalytic subunit-like n=1 Tax=Sphaeramia orbicularis TaxID=375764 RepID=A0A673BU09_9TELE|nr:calpain-2 catalytic subunit-like [Sphaeramia orbicularis]
MASSGVKMIHSLYEKGGEGSLSNPVKFKDQDYQQLKESLVNEGKLFEDETFPANLKSLGKLEDFPAEQLKEVKWLRPKDLSSNPSFVVDGKSRFDFKQGDVGNCWFLSSIGGLTFRKSLLAQVVPLDQRFKENYAGIFHFRFWRFGKWVDVVVDDLLPTRNKEPVSVSSRSGDEFWAPLLEKAYAKICGSYGDMIAGNPSEAFKDFSGGVHMTYTLSKAPSDLWDIMNRAVECKTMMGCGTHSGEKGKKYEELGLVRGHAYSVTGVEQVESKGDEVNLVRIWNPWGEKEWKGDWSDKSELWNSVSEETRNNCLKVRNDGEFWMKLADFVTYFEDMDICCDSPNFVDGDSCQWNCSLKEGRWEAGKSAGGCYPDTELFWTNPQYRIKVAVEGDRKDKNVLLSLLQKPDEEYRSKMKYHIMAFTIYKVPSEAPKGRLPSSLFQDVEPLITSDSTTMRELIVFYRLEPDEYLVIPHTNNPNEAASFIFTVYSKTETELD